MFLLAAPRPSSRFSLSLAAALLLASGTAVGQATTNPSPTSTPTPPAITKGAIKQPRSGPLKAGWWNDRVFYQIFLRSFADSMQGPLRSDGIGDLRGLIDKLDYLNDARPEAPGDLEVRGLWLTPIYPSPSYHGYDIVDYYSIAKQYGTPDDFRELLTQCHKRDIKVILDLVPNHTSNQNAWFQEALDPASPKHDWFIWSTTNPGWKGPWNQTVWHPLSKANIGIKGKDTKGADGPFYYGLFSATMPDFNFKNADATAQMYDVVKHWLTQYDVDGFRLDAIRHLIEDGQVQENTKATHDWLRGFQKHLKSVKPDCMTVGEVWSSSEVTSSFVPQEMDLVFEFDLADAMLKAAEKESTEPLRPVLDKIFTLYPPNQYATFLTNHDMPRVATRLKGNQGHMRTAAQLLLTLPGVPFIYYGEEIGMSGDKPDEHIRTPMQWSSDSVAGFTLGEPWQPLNPDYKTVNVKSQLASGGDLLKIYERYIQIRNDSPALSWGDYLPVMSDSPKVFAFMRHAEGIDRLARFGGVPMAPTQTVLVVINLSGETITDYGLSVAVSPLRTPIITEDIGRNAPTFPPKKIDELGGFSSYRPVGRLSPYSAYVINVENGTPIPTSRPAPK